MIAEAPGELRLEARCVEFEQARGERGLLRPHDRRAMFAAGTVGHGQDGERAAGQEFLLGDAAVRLGVMGHQDDRDLVVGPAACADAGLFAHRAEAALRRGDQPGGDAPSALQDEAGAIGPALALDDFVGRYEFHLRASGETAQQGGPQEAVLGDPAHRRGGFRIVGGFAMIEMQEEGAGAAVVAGVGNPDVADRLGIGRQLVPEVESREQALARIGYGGGAAVETLLRHRGERYAVDEGRRETRFAGGQREEAAVEACADDGEVEGRAVGGAPIHEP